MKEIIEIDAVKYQRIEEKKKLKKGDFIEISGIMFGCYNEEKLLCVAVEELSEEVVQNSAYHTINKKCIKGNKVMFNSNVIDGEYGTSVIRKLLQNFEIKYLDASKLNKVYGKDYVRLLKEEEIETLGEEFHKSTDDWYWTMSPYYWYGSGAYVFVVGGSGTPGGLTRAHVHNSFVVRPVVSLKSDVLLTGDGSKDNPYLIN